MTCIAACVDEKGTIWMGGDSALTADSGILAIRTGRKVWHKGAFLMGCSGSMRTLQLLQHAFVPPLYDPSKSIETYLITSFLRATRRCLKEAGEDEKKLEEKMLVGLQGRLFQIEQDYQIGEAFCLYDAIGSGAKVAKGALFVTADLAPDERIRKALAAAEAHIHTVRAPFYVEKLEFCRVPNKASMFQRFKWR